jgi:hypothetical protein
VASLGTHLCNDSAWIRLLEAFSQRRAVALQPAALLPHDGEVPLDALPHARPAANARPVGLLTAEESDEIKVADDTGPQGLEHGVLQIVVVLEQALLGGRAGGGHGRCVGGGVKVDGDAVDVVDGADEVVDARVGGEAEDVGLELGSDELALKGNDQVNLGGVRGSEPLGLVEIGLVAHRQHGKRRLRVIELVREAMLVSCPQRKPRVRAGEAHRSNMPPLGIDHARRSEACAPSAPWSCSRWRWRA